MYESRIFFSSFFTNHIFAVVLENISNYNQKMAAHFYLTLPLKFVCRVTNNLTHRRFKIPIVITSNKQYNGNLFGKFS